MQGQRKHKPKCILYLFLIIVFVLFGCTRHAEFEQQIVFAAKAFYDSVETTGDAFVYVSGTLSGEGVAYKNNTMAISCYKDRMECLTNKVEQIAPNYVGRLDTPTSYPVTKWDANEIVAKDFADTGHCRKVTINIVRKSEIVVWVEEPANQSTSACKDADTRLLKWTIEDSPGWKALNKNNK